MSEHPVAATEISTEAIPNEYIVIFKHHTPEDLCQQHCEWAQSTHTEAAALRAASDGPELTGVGEQFRIDNLAGYVGKFDESLKNEIEAREEVAYVEPNYPVYACSPVVQKPVPSWGLARMSSNHRLPFPLPPDLAYKYDSTAGQGTWGYVIDTGIMITHVDFGGRARWGFNAVPGSSNTDMNGHGTHVAGTMGGARYGMAKKCNLVAVKVLGDNGQGSNDSVITGIHWAYNDAKINGRLGRSVVNMSLGGGRYQALNDVVAAAVRGGLAIVVAAGNSNADAINFSPASEPLAYTVGSIEPVDTKSDFSNWGKPLDVWGPGRNITSCWIQPGNQGTNTISGTSMASPHIAGLGLCLYAQYPASFPTPIHLTGYITWLATYRNTRVIPPLPLGTTTLISNNGS